MNKYYVPVHYNKVCQYCGKEFEAHNKQKVYCSRRCKDVSLRIRKGIKCNPNTEPFHKICIVCGKPFDSYKERAVTCSHECAILHKHPRADEQVRPMQNSTKEWVNQKHGESFEYVSHTRGRIKLKCKTCGGILERAESTVREKNVVCEYCKEAQKRQEAQNKMVRILEAIKDAKTPKRCVACGTVFYSVHNTQRYCSKSCKTRKKARLSNYRRRCKEYGVYYDSSVTREKVIKRDKNTCQICGKECNAFDREWGTSGPDYPTLDHIVPLAKGGTHTWDNVQCACGACNSYKRDLLEYTKNEKCS